MYWAFLLQQKGCAPTYLGKGTSLEETNPVTFLVLILESGKRLR